MRQPPEKLLTGASSWRCGKPRPSSSACARARRRRRRPRPAPCARRRWHGRRRGLGRGQSGLRAHQRQVAFQHEVGGALVGLGHVLRHLADAPARRHVDIAASACSRPVSSANRLDLPAPLRPTRPAFSPGCSVTLACVEHDLGAAAQRQVLQRDHAAQGDHSRAQARVSSSTASSPALVGSHTTLPGAGRRLEVRAFVADLQHQHAVGGEVLRRSRSSGG
jgi:hypothetical protein